MDEDVQGFSYLGRKIYSGNLKEDKVEKLRKCDNITNKTFRNKFRKGMSLQVQNITSKFPLLLKVKFQFLEQMNTKPAPVTFLCHFLSLTLAERWQNGQIRNTLGVRTGAEVAHYKVTRKRLNKMEEGIMLAFIYMCKTLNAIK
jgi:hypothetical protein